MANEQKLPKRIGLTPGKMMLIGVLSVTLVGVIYIQYGPSGSDGAEAEVDATTDANVPPTPQLPRFTASTPAPVAAALAPTDGSSDSTLLTWEEKRWAAPDVARIVEHDPFALPPTFPQPVQVANAQGLTRDGIIAADAATRASQLADAVAKLQTELDSLRARGVSVIVRERDEYVAMIGDRTLHVGDEIDGFTVTAIEPNGVRVEKKVQQ